MRRILVVDDLPENAYMLRVLLEGHGFEVECARHGAEALTIARRRVPDLIVSDLLMPVMDGYSLLRHCRSDGQLRDVPFAVYTATYTTPDDERLAMSLGADAFILKPAEPEEFMRRIGELLDRPRLASGSDAGEHDAETLALHNEVLIRKLGEKMLQLEEANRNLHADLAERERMEAALRDSEALLRMAGRVGRLGAWKVELPGNVVTWSDEVRAIHDVDAAFEPSLESFLGHLESPSRALMSAAIDRCAFGAEPFDLELRVVTARGRRIWVRVLGEAVRDAGGRVARIQGALQDITERRRLEERFRQQQRMESLGTLAGGVAHDLNNALSPILMSVGLLKLREPDSASRSLLEDIERSALRGADMVRQVLAFARGVDGPRVPVDLRQVAQEAGRIAASTSAAPIAVAIEAPEQLRPVQADPTQMHQLVANLCVNARDAMPSGGEIRIRLEDVELGADALDESGDLAPGPHVRLTVTDTGEGMSREVLERIFEPFFTTKEVGRGTGLGLSTALSIVRSHRGSVRASSDPGRGTTFEVLLPAAPGPLPAPAGGASRAELAEGRGELILVVDDEATVRTVLGSVLERHGYRAMLAGGGAEALDLHARHRGEIAAVITDMAMPGMDGQATIRALLERDPSALVIASSGRSSQDAADKALAAGARIFLAKPCTAAEVLGALRRLLGERP